MTWCNRTYQRQIDILEKNIDAQNRDLLESQRELMHWKDVAHNRINSSNTANASSSSSNNVFVQSHGSGSMTPYSSMKLSPSLARTSGRAHIQTLPLSQVIKSRNNTQTPARDRQSQSTVTADTSSSSSFIPLSAVSTKTNATTTPTLSLSYIPENRDTTPTTNNNTSGLNATQLVQDATNDLKDIMFALGL